MRTLPPYAISFDTAEERATLSQMAFQTVLRLERKRKPLTADEQREHRLCQMIWECLKQMPWEPRTPYQKGDGA